MCGEPYNALRCRSKPRALPDDGRDPRGIPADTVNHRRRERVLEVLADEVQPRLALDQPAGVTGLAVLFEDRQIDPRQAVVVAGAPDDVADLERATVRENRSSV